MGAQVANSGYVLLVPARVQCIASFFDLSDGFEVRIGKVAIMRLNEA